MKEILEKFFWLFSEWVAKMQEANQTEALSKFTEASKLAEDIKKEANKEIDLEKFFDSEKWQETLKKYVDIYISWSSLWDVLNDIKTAMAGISTLTKAVEDIKKEKEQDDELLSKTLDDVLDKVEVLSKKTFSKIN